MQTRTPKLTEEEKLYQQFMTAFQSRSYDSAITAGKQFLEQYPKSAREDEVMIRLGEAFQGLLEQNYREAINEGMDETASRTAFLEKYGHYGCWQTRDGSLVYNNEMFQQLLKEKPLSPYADEAAYNLIAWEKDYHGDPSRIEGEIKALENVITLYPGTSLRAKILYQMGYRFHRLYELYRFSSDPAVRNEAKAEQSRSRAEYLYKLCISTPQGSRYSNKAFENLEMLKHDKRLSMD